MNFIARGGIGLFRVRKSGICMHRSFLYPLLTKKLFNMSCLSNKEIKGKSVFAANIPGIAIAVVAAVCLTGCFCSDSSRYKSAIELQEKGDLDKAIAKLSQIKESSEFYEQAQYNLYLDYLELQDSLAAGTALTNAVRNGNWDVFEAYDCYAGCLLNGTLAPYIESDASACAQLLEVCPDNEYRNVAGEIYFFLSQFDKAYEIFLPNTSWSDKANGYVGVMYLHGLAGLDINTDTAYKYLSQAPDENPFLVEKGDLALYLRKAGDKESFYNSIVKADSYYGMAASQEPDNKAYADRYKVTQQIVKAKQSHNNDSFLSGGKTSWDNYSFGNGYYGGEVAFNARNFTRGPHGWGYIDFKSGEINMGRFSYSNNDGLSLKFLPRESGGYSVYVGEYRNKMPYNGTYIFESGDAWTGKFRQTSEYFELTDGVESDLHGNKVRDIKN